MSAGAILFTVGCYALTKGDWSTHPHLLVWVLAAAVFCYGTVQGLFVLWVVRVQNRIRKEDMQEASHPLFGRPF